MNWNKTNMSLELADMVARKLSPVRVRLMLTAEPVAPNVVGAMEFAKKSGIVHQEDGQHIYRTYRALSEVYIESHRVSFTKPGVLKGALGKFTTLGNSSIPVFKDHQRTVDAWIGKVTDAYYDNAGEPKGVNQIIAYDKPACGDVICRGVLSGALSSVSVTVDFEWEKSHPDMKDDDFFMKVWFGEVDKDGKPYHIVATKIHSCMETSLVWAGADPNAKQIAASVPALTVGEYAIRALDIGKSDQCETSANAPAIDGAFLPEIHREQEETQMFELFGKPFSEITAETKDSFESAVTEQLTAPLSARIAELLEQVNAKTEDLVKTKVIADAYCASLKNRLAAATAVTMSDNSALVRLAQQSTIADLEMLVHMYEHQADEKLPLTCPKCHTAVTERRQSGLSKPPDETHVQPSAQFHNPQDEVGAIERFLKTRQ